MIKYNKKLTKLILAALTSLCILTGCHSDNEPEPKTTTESKSTETKDTPEIDEKTKESAASQEVMESIPEDMPIMGPPVDADGNLPEEFGADEYYEGYAEEAKKAQEAEEKAKQESKDKAEKDEKEKKTSEKQDDSKKGKDSEKKDDSSKKAE